MVEASGEEIIPVPGELKDDSKPHMFDHYYQNLVGIAKYLDIKHLSDAQRFGEKLSMNWKHKKILIFRANAFSCLMMSSFAKNVSRAS